MDRRTFWQVVLLILVGGAVFLAVSEFLRWQDARAYGARLNEISAEAEQRAAPSPDDREAEALARNDVATVDAMGTNQAN